MSVEHDRVGRESGSPGGDRGGAGVAGKVTRTQRLPARGGEATAGEAPVQRQPAGPPAEDPFAMHLIGAKAATIAEAAREVSEYAGFAYAELTGRGAVEGRLLALNEKLGALGDVLHQHAGERGRADEQALRKALRDAGGVADKLGSRHTGISEHETELRARIAMIERLASGGESEARGAVDLTAAELREQAQLSLGQLEDTRDRVYTLLAVDTSALDATIAKTSGWIATLSDAGASAADAKRLARAVLDQQATLVELGPELEDVLTTPGPGLHEAAAAYVLAMAKSGERKAVARPFVEQAQIARRRRPLLRAEQTLEADQVTAGQLAELDPTAGRTARREHGALDRQQDALDRRLTRQGRGGDHELRAFEVDARAQGLRHQTQLLEAQATQLAAALGQLGDTGTNRFDYELANLRTDLLSLAVELPILRGRYARAVEQANDAHGADHEARWELLHARERALDELERDLQRFLGKGGFLATLHAAQEKADDAQVRAFAFQMVTTIALTLAGSAAAQLAKGAAEGAVLARAARASRLAAAEADAAAIAARAEAAGTAASLAADVAVNTLGMVAQGDDASLLTLLTLNTLTPLLIGRVQTQFASVTAVNATASRFERITTGALAFTHDKLVLSIEMIAGAALDHASRTLLGARSTSPTEQDAEQWLYQGAAMALGRHLSVRTKLIATRLDTLRAQTRTATFDALVARTAALHAASDSLALRGDPATARTLLDEYGRILADQLATTGQDEPGAVSGPSKALPPPIQSADEIATLPNRIVGRPVDGADAGHELLRRLNRGELSALRDVGAEPPDAVARGLEWGLGLTTDRRVVLVRGDRGEVDWSMLPGVVPLAHTHPPVPGGHLPRDAEGRRRLDLAELARATDVPLLAREIVLPSAPDVVVMGARGIAEHRVITPFVITTDPTTGRRYVTDAGTGAAGDRLEFRIVGAQPDGQLAATGQDLFRATLEPSFGAETLPAIEVWATTAEHGERAGNIYLERPRSATTNHGPRRDGDQAVRSATSDAKAKSAAQASEAERREALGTDPKRGFVEHEADVGVLIEKRYGYFERDPSGAGEWISLSGPHEGKTFDLLGIPASAARYHGDDLAKFLPSVDAHFRKSIDYIVLDERSMTEAQRRTLEAHIDRNFAADKDRLIRLR